MSDLTLVGVREIMEKEKITAYQDFFGNWFLHCFKCNSVWYEHNSVHSNKCIKCGKKLEKE